MGNSKTTQDRLSMDISGDMKKIDSVMTDIIKDRESWKKFLSNPNEYFIGKKVHPPTTIEINDRVNRIFFATLCNTKLINLIFNEYKNFKPSGPSVRTYVEGLKRGEIANDVQLDLAAANHLLRQPKILKRAFELTLFDLNNRGILNKKYSKHEINLYISRFVEAVSKRLPLRDLPVLEEWDDNYGIGKPFGIMVVEVGPLATVIAAAEFGIAFTAWVCITATPSFQDLFIASFQGDKGATQAASTLSLLYTFASDVATHVQTFES